MDVHHGGAVVQFVHHRFEFGCAETDPAVVRLEGDAVSAEIVEGVADLVDRGADVW
ncbi:MAG: hypothetical protein JWP55_1246 [Mycobacterium sp.]|nr:hypothetical protein [Mycobacterium sp.]